MKKIFLIMNLIMLFVLVSDVSSKEVPFTLEDRDRLMRVEARLTEMDKRFEPLWDRQTMIF
ncbi:MAG: hypothetical protein N3A62_06720 [Thermodesulfovibrionales bacterium]|nr:hypothetical protein [Thermodesulfovibrionales bacterium]